MGQLGLCVNSGAPGRAGGHLELERRKEAPCTGILPTITPAAHALNATSAVPHRDGRRRSTRQPCLRRDRQSRRGKSASSASTSSKLIFRSSQTTLQLFGGSPAPSSSSSAHVAAGCSPPAPRPRTFFVSDLLALAMDSTLHHIGDVHEIVAGLAVEGRGSVRPACRLATDKRPAVRIVERSHLQDGARFAYTMRRRWTPTVTRPRSPSPRSGTGECGLTVRSGNATRRAGKPTKSGFWGIV